MADEYIRKEFAGGAPSTTIPGSLTSGATSITIASGTGQPTGSVGKFVMVIDRGLATEEKVLVTSRTGTTLSSVQRGYDGTTAQAHSAGATIQHCIDAYTLDQANAMANAMTAQYDLVMRGASAGAYSRIPVGANGQVLAVSGGVPGFATLTSATLADGVVTTAKLADGAVTSAKIADGTIATADLADSSVTSAKIAAGTIATSDIADGAVTAVKITLPRVRCTRSTPQSVTHNTNTVLTWDTEAYDTDSIHSTSSNTSRLTIPTGMGGLWLVSYEIEFSASSSAALGRSVWIQKNGSAVRDGYLNIYVTSAADVPVLSCGMPMVLAAGDYVEIGVYQNSGAAINIPSTSTNSHFSACFMSA